MDKKLYLCIHGHFYQPPRENPWTGEIELQPSAAPYHDWNERIYYECYKPNSEAPIIDGNGNIIRRVNNYEHINFNFGPTLLKWLKQKHPDTYSGIINADRESASAHNGHGNAIAQVYNHIIMPLANERDKITQIKWGLADFKHHFKRDAESIWLPETACNYDTIVTLVNENIKYIILDQPQAEKIRKINNEDNIWEDVSSGNIDCTRPYRCFVNKKENKYIDIFFYNGNISRRIAFNDILSSAEVLMSAVKSEADNYTGAEKLISIAVDGETFGHHKPFTERTIAYLFSELAPLHNVKTVNFAEYLELHTPEYEVRLKEGKNGEGTSWSCIHGVDRWKSDCGCSTGGKPTWNQKWRTPLRDGLNYLKDKIALLYEKLGLHYFKDVWSARNDYINIILDPSDEQKEKFLSIHSKRELNNKENNTCFGLLEMQKFSLLMFTSCGWFFSDISGIETVKILEYAKRTIELAEQITGDNYEDRFLEFLELAESNEKEQKNGKEIYLRISSNS